MTKLEGNWWLRQAKSDDLKDGRLVPGIFDETPSAAAGWYDSETALSVHEILIKHQVLDEGIKAGECASSIWVAERDWLYRKDFDAPEKRDGPVRLVFKGLDTVVDVYLNNEHIATHADMYLPLSVDVTDRLKARNSLMLYFHSPYKVMKTLEVPEEWKGYIKPNQLIRKSILDYVPYLGAKPYLTPIGIFGDVCMEAFGKAYITDVDPDIRFTEWFEEAYISVSAGVGGDASGCRLKVSVYDPDGSLAVSSNELSITDGACRSGELKISRPKLWWPRPYGGRPLYEVRTELACGGQVIDSDIKKIGLRKIEKTGDLRFKVNNVEIKLWGSNFVPPYSISHRWQPDRGIAALEMARDANMNALRIWGEGMPYGDELYDFADREGILLWHDFFIWFGIFPDSGHYREIYRAECEYLIKRLKHRPGILLWCGGNESYMFLRSDKAEGKQFGYAVYQHDLARICSRLDPDRCYIMSSPSGGSFPNDAQGGDTHYYNGSDYNAGLRYPVFVTENCYTTTLSKKSMLRFMTEEEIFPKDFRDALHHGAYNPFFDLAKDRVSFRYWRTLPVPGTWLRHIDEYAHCEFWGIERFYDADDVDSILYKYSAPAADYYKHIIERLRCGRPAYDASGARRTQGHFTWKLNDAFPSINFTLIDAYLEPTSAYFAVKRAYSPVLLSIEIEDHIYIWGVNDTAQAVEGRLYFKLFSRFGNKVEAGFELPVFLHPGESRVLTDLDRLGAIRRECILHVSLADREGGLITSNTEVFENERDISFPDAGLTVRQDNGDLIITSDQFAHYVELTGDEDGDQFGWYFDDNYFELLPFETKRIKVGGAHKKGFITAKPHFSTQQTVLNYSR